MSVSGKPSEAGAGLVYAYEQMRRERQSRRGGLHAGDLGCRFLIQVGMATWMQAWLNRARPAAPECKAPFWAAGKITRRVTGHWSLPESLRPALTRLLAGMVLMSA